MIIKMTVKEYIDRNLPFYHITPARNKDSILKHGLNNGTFNAVCAVRSDNEDILYDIASTQLSGNEETKFIVIKLLPNKHNIKAEDVFEDDVTDPTAPLHNYLRANEYYTITEEDIITEFDITQKRNNVLDPDIIIPLTGYLNKPVQGNLDNLY